jgi:anaerobic selenocysteine-containing dehydrogenase
MGVVQMSKGSLKNISDTLMSESMIVCSLAKNVFGKNAGSHWEKYSKHYDNIRDDVARTIQGFENYNERVRKLGGFYLPNSNRDGKFNSLSGKANFNMARPEVINLKEDEYLMMTIRSHDQFNTTIYGLDDRYRGVLNERRVIFMNEKDMREAGLEKQQVVDLFNYHDGTERICPGFKVIPYSIPEKCTATYFPETNVLVPLNSTADKSNTPTSKSVIIRIKPSQNR